MMKLRNNLDEQQEQVLLKIEHNGCWFSFWALLASIVIQFVVYSDDMSGGVKILAAEWIVFMVLAIYITAACIKNGIWDRRFKAKTSTNLFFSILAGLASGVINFINAYKNYPEYIGRSIASLVFVVGFTLVLTFGLLELCRIAYDKKRKKIEEEPEEDEL